MKKLPLVSLLMPVYNSYDFVRSENQNLIVKAFDSLLSQTYKNFELIILDNQSTDDTPAICKRYAKRDLRIRYIVDSKKRFPEGGITQAASFAKGKYCMVVNDDDLWDSNYIEILVNFLESHQNIDLCYTNGNFIDVNNNIIRKIITANDQIYSNIFSPLSNLARYINNRNPIPISFGLYRREAFLDLLPYEDFDNLKANVDNHFIAKLFIKKKKVNFINKILFNYRVKSRKLDPKKVSDMPNLDRRDLIGFYYLRHHFFFHNKLVSTFSEDYRPTQNQMDYIGSISLDSLFKHFNGILLWLKTEDRNDSQNNNLKVLFQEYSALVKENLENFPKIGNFSSDSVENIRFEPFLNCNLLKINKICLQELSLIIDRQKDNNQIIIDLRNIVSSELNVHDQRINEIESELAKTTNILTNTLNAGAKKQDKPKVSIITVSYNLEKFVEETIRSVANQNFKEFEHIVIDGGSTDDSIELIKKYPNVILVSEKDTGYPDAFWKGLRLARGEYIMQCAISDGYATTEWIKKCVEILDKNKDISLVWGFPQNLTEKSRQGSISYPQFHYNEAPQKQEMFNYWLKTGFFYPEGNLCVRKSVMLKCYPTIEECKKGIWDWLEFSYRFNSLGYVSMHLPTLANFGRTHDNQLGEQLTKEGETKIRANNYFQKVNYYKIKLLTGLVRHDFIDSEGNKIDLKFDKKKFVMEDIIRIFSRIDKRYLKPKKCLDFIKREIFKQN